ncbi:hypothetical protein [Agreia sp. COWG]|uniref:hypothetical protein n=1 Tax=Agreia sp. COWG TaxID=2773266 RepID=UPI0019291E85|nr:hypothetical protein [Agreia sp. COWG]CAD6002493.1 LysM domain-containing protein [Agreia sp. COWG]
MNRASRGVRLALLSTVVIVSLAACAPAAAPAPTVTVTQSAAPLAAPTVTVTPTPSPTQAPEPVAAPEPVPAPEPPAPPVPPNAAGGQTNGGNTATTPLVSDTGAQPFATGPATAVNDYEFSYTVVKEDQVLAIASRFNLQTDDVDRVNFRCSDPLEVQPGDVLDIRWPLPGEQIGSGC